MLFLFFSTEIAVAAAIAFAIENAGARNDVQKQIDLLWKIAIAIGGAAGCVIGWLVKLEHDQALVQFKYEHDEALNTFQYACDQALALSKDDSEKSLAAIKHRHDLALANHKATLETAQKLVDHADTLTVRKVEAIAKGQAVELVIQERLLQQTQENTKELENYRRELDDKFKEKNDAKVAQTHALELLNGAIGQVQIGFRALTNAGYGLDKHELNMRIDRALQAKSAMDAAIVEVKKAFKTLQVGFQSLWRKYKGLLVNIIKHVNEVPDSELMTEAELSMWKLDYERAIEPAMRQHAAHLRTISEYIKISILHVVDPTGFRETRVKSEKK